MDVQLAADPRTTQTQKPPCAGTVQAVSLERVLDLLEGLGMLVAAAPTAAGDALVALRSPRSVPLEATRNAS